jgi:hypothetical protein
LDCLDLVRVVKALLDKQYDPDGFHIGENLARYRGTLSFIILILIGFLNIWMMCQAKAQFTVRMAHNIPKRLHKFWP